MVMMRVEVAIKKVMMIFLGFLGLGGGTGYSDHCMFGRKPKLLLQLMTDNYITSSTSDAAARAQHEFFSESCFCEKV